MKIMNEELYKENYLYKIVLLLHQIKNQNEFIIEKNPY